MLRAQRTASRFVHAGEFLVDAISQNHFADEYAYDQVLKNHVSPQKTHQYDERFSHQYFKTPTTHTTLRAWFMGRAQFSRPLVGEIRQESSMPRGQLLTYSQRVELPVRGKREWHLLGQAALALEAQEKFTYSWPTKIR